MQWEVLLIPLIALVVVILSTIFGGEKQQPGDGKEPANELERFLAESRKRREAGASAPPAPAVAESPPVAKDRQEKPPALPVKRRDPTRPRKERRPPVRQAPPVASAPAAAQPEEPAVDMGKVQLALVRRLPRRKPSPALEKVARLLRTPESAQAAFILAEIFQPPLSRRPPSGQ